MSNRPAPEMKKASTFAYRLKQARKDHGFTQKSLSEELSRRLGQPFTSVSISAYETRGIMPRIAVVNCIADILEIPVAYLMGTSDQKLTDISLDKLYEVPRHELYSYHGAPLYCLPEGCSEEDGYWVLIDGYKYKALSLNDYQDITAIPEGTKFYTQSLK